MKLALRPAQFFSWAPCSRAPSPAQGLLRVSHRLRSAAWRSGPGHQPQLPVPSPGARAQSPRHWACSELAAGAGLLLRRSHSAAGGRAGARLQLELRRLELELPGVSPAPLSLRTRQPEPAREPREAAGQHPSGLSLVRSPKPRAGQPPGRSLASGTRAARWQCRGTSRTARKLTGSSPLLFYNERQVCHQQGNFCTS